VKSTHEGLSLWYGTPDAAAPSDYDVVACDDASLVIGAHPASPTNSVLVHYRVDGGLVRTVPGRALRTDYDRDVQYFAVTFPPLPPGDRVEYCPVLSCAGRQVPPPHIASRLPSAFRLAATGAPRTKRGAQRFSAALDLVAAVTVHVDVQFVGETAHGLRVNVFGRGGSAEGNGFRARVLEGSTDHMTIRRDGMGIVRIRSVFATDDGATLDVESGGYVDWGPDGYERALAQTLPDSSTVVLSPIVHTRHPNYDWLSRVQCFGVGRTHLASRQVTYDVYAAAPTPLALQPADSGSPGSPDAR
jgi:Protein of unknown function (DUF3237)